MRKSVYFACTFLSLALFMGLASTAFATKITNVTTDTVLFEDDFEGVGACTGSYSISSTDDCDPTADIGSYTLEEHPSFPYAIQVCTGSCDTISGAAEGSNYLRLVNANNAARTIYANLSSVQSTSGDVLRLESMVAYTDLTDADPAPRAGLFAFTSQAGSMPGIFASISEGIVTTLVPSGGSYTYRSLYYDDNHQFTTDSSANPLTAAEDTWHSMMIDYAIGASTFTITLDDVTITGVPVYAATSSISCVRIMAGETNEEAVYLDHVAEVPEPSTIVMLLAGALAGTCFVRRRA